GPGTARPGPAGPRTAQRGGTGSAGLASGVGAMVTRLGARPAYHLADRLAALDEVVALAGGRLEPEAVTAATSLAAKAGDRLRLEVDRLVELVDLLVWVLDPQKYADAAVHDRYLRPLAEYAGVMLVVLNQVDRLDEAGRAACLADLRALLSSEGLAEVPVLATSATTGDGLPD